MIDIVYIFNGKFTVIFVLHTSKYLDIYAVRVILFLDVFLEFFSMLSYHLEYVL